MLRFATLICAAVLTAAAGGAAAAPARDYSGAWTITSRFAEGSVTAKMQLTAEGGGYSGQSAPLDPLWSCPLLYKAVTQGASLRLSARCRGIDVGAVTLAPQGTQLVGQGVLFGTRITLTMSRPAEPPAGPPRMLEHAPAEYHPITSAAPDPVLRIRPGDRVKTRTIDPYGINEKDAPASMPGNPGTGPFYVEGALPGDTVAIRIISLKTNRPTARMNVALDPASLSHGYVQTPGAVTDVFWNLDPGAGVATLRTPSEKLKGFRTPLRPMLGVVTVALPGGRAVPNRELGEWGGNLDYPEIREGVTLYLPVYQPGALIFLGDGHARQADGEIAGQGLETSLDVEFQVELIRDQAMRQPWAENADHVMVSGIAGSLDNALRRATAGLATWLKARYGLDDSEVAVVLGTSIQYDVAEVVSAQIHVVAKIRKDVLSQLPSPDN